MSDRSTTASAPATSANVPTYRLRSVPIIVTLALVLVACGHTYAMWQAYMGAPWTRDGSVRVYVVSLAPQVSGQVVALPVADNQFVHKGDPLMQIDSRDYEIAVKLAEATVAQAAADAQNKVAEAKRRASLSDLAATLEERETYASSAQAAEAVHQQALANLDKAKLNLQRTDIRSPVNGWVTNLQVRQGDYATIGTRAVSIVDADSFWVDGYFEETKIAAIRDGDPAKVWLLGYKTVINGHVDSLARGIVVANASPGGNGLADVSPIFTWVRLAQRVPVRVHLDDVPSDIRLVGGMTATVEVLPKAREP
ncbi:HlyD family secretion protein [Lichenihabitans sp. PAMC28606]|uniref:efflux RND transporter periplasmic adaptor subunit n=1 Tax=Lichenihabitans sp. PAMC28606 TaxID=2880932 RepID=UPI001D0AA4C3|nr:HlyD family secretion protein [Lichenihabitans sp. PAMC28606]UDL95769.1 HlyD family secretion protein [Lichenihabitans sp. PAMC28606]